MSALFAFCMASLFAGWIWYLKQELANSHDQAVTPEGLHMAHAAHAQVHQTTHKPQPSRAKELRKQRNSEGVPVWTID